MLDTVGRIIDRMSELKGLASQDPMKSEQDRASYNNEFKDLQVQLICNFTAGFNGVSLFANHTTNDTALLQAQKFSLMRKDTPRSMDNTIDYLHEYGREWWCQGKYTQAALLSALTLQTNKTLLGVMQHLGMLLGQLW